MGDLGSVVLFYSASVPCLLRCPRKTCPGYENIFEKMIVIDITARRAGVASLADSDGGGVASWFVPGPGAGRISQHDVVSDTREDVMYACIVRSPYTLIRDTANRCRR